MTWPSGTIVVACITQSGTTGPKSAKAGELQSKAIGHHRYDADLSFRAFVEVSDGGLDRFLIAKERRRAASVYKYKVGFIIACFSSPQYFGHRLSGVDRIE